MPISPRDLQPLSEPLTIPKSDGLGDPRLLAQEEELSVHASLAPATSSDGLVPSNLSAPVAIDCLADAERTKSGALGSRAVLRRR
jgi:hypothetical protein